MSALQCSLPTVYVVDDEQSVLKAMSRLLRSARFNVVTFASAQKFLEEHDPEAWGCLLLDCAMPGFSGLQLQQELTRRGIERPIVFLTGRGDVPMSVRAMKSGAVDFLTKPVNDDDLLQALRAAVERDRIGRLERAGAADIQRRLSALTPREREVMLHVVCGKLNKQVAAELGTVEKTIKVHRARVMEKMEAESLADLVRLAERAGMSVGAS